MDEPTLMTVAEVAAFLRMSRDYVYDAKEEIGFVRLGRAIRFRREAVDKFVQANVISVPAQIARIKLRSTRGRAR